MRRVMFVFIFFFLFQKTYGGTVVKFNTTSNHMVITDNNVDIQNSYFMRFSVHACYDQLLRLGSVGHLASNSYFLEVVLTHSYIGIRDNCGSCGVSNVKYLKTFDCSNSFKFWMSWSEPGVVEIGTDYDINQNLVTRYQSNTPFNVEFITLRSYYRPGYWNVIKDDPPDVLYPNPTGTTTVYVNETMPSDSPILSVVVTDPENDSIAIVLLTHTELFDIYNESLILKGKLDYETTTSYNISLSITDGLNKVLVCLSLIIVDVIDEPPSLFVADNFELEEELAIGTELSGLYNVTDADDADTLEFVLEGEDSYKFDMHTNTGTIVVKDRIDREAFNSFDQLGPLVIKVVDSSGFTSQASLNITVMDINDNPPVCVVSPERVTVYEDHSSETPIANMSCIDEDLPNNTHITYSAISPEHLINGIRFENDILVADEGAFDLEILKQNNISLVIQINDTQNPVHNNSVYLNLLIEILSVNEYKPTFLSNANESQKLITLWSTVQPGELVHTVSAHDDDWGTDGIITYSITNISFENDMTNHSIKDLLSINSITGDITVNRILVDCTNTTLYLTVVATDGALLARSSFLEISFVIKDASFYWPILEKELFTVNVSCYQHLDVSILRIATSNPEVTVPVVFSMEQHTDKQFLLINETTGDVILVHRPETVPFWIVSTLCVANPLATTKFSIGYLIMEFPSCTSGTFPTNSTADQTNDSAGDTFWEFLDALQKIILIILCGVETLLLVCIGIVYLIKVKKCRTSNVHPHQDNDPLRPSSREFSIMW
ncbi:hypothetical protein LOTGIDRAFT_160343 [Lottia gigantea]|uniref:Cadherin domain-containing protein n=1 Tax=Lottia gigantea TaxID=225164 RepID=V4AQ57_LOTGI|nr:hypothetical protein LOTGIDRAFT_160343 [Lottia gigantea]ESO95796.1 hypothetical protein LOTGIDRAFT_160343 [Lottia gigantea]